MQHGKTQTHGLPGDLPSRRAGGGLSTLIFVLLTWIAGTAELRAGQAFQKEAEPNGTSGTATPLSGTNLVVRAHLFPNSDMDYYSFSAIAGDRVYAATMTGFSSAADSTLRLLDTDGMFSLENDADDGAFTTTASSIAGAVLPATGTYFLQVTAAGTTQIRPYDLHFQLRRGSPTAETEPNGSPAQTLPASGWVSGVVSASGETDAFRIALNAGDSVFLSLDLDPERDLDGAWNGNVGISSINGATPIARADSSGTINPFSEAFFWTVNATGDYDIYVSGTGGTLPRTYNLSVSVHPNTPESSNCTTYTSAGSTSIPTGVAFVESTILVSGDANDPNGPRIADLDVSIELTHSKLDELDVFLFSPPVSKLPGNKNGLFTDLGVSGNATMNLRLDDEAAIPVTSFVGAAPILSGMAYQPMFDNRLAWMDGKPSAGTWTLRIWDDNLGTGSGNLVSWSLHICEVPPPPVCPTGTGSPVTFYTERFDPNDPNAPTFGYAASGPRGDWGYRVPGGMEIDTCNTGPQCWKTGFFDYKLGGNENLVSPGISLAGRTGTLIATWAQMYQMRSAAQDHISVDVRVAVDDSNPRRLFEHLDDEMNTVAAGPFSEEVRESAGWGYYSGDISSYAGQTVELVFHLDSTTGTAGTTFEGFAIDDVTITECQPLPATATPTRTRTFTPSATRTPTPLGPSPTPTRTATDGPSPTPTRTATDGPSPTPTRTATDGPSPTPTRTATDGPSPTPTRTATDGPSPTPTRTATDGPSPTSTRTSPPGATDTPTPTGSPTPEILGASHQAHGQLAALLLAAASILGGLARRRPGTALPENKGE